MPDNAVIDYRRRCARFLAQITMERMPSLTISQQILAHDGLASLANDLPAHESAAAREAAEALRRAEACQMVFADLIQKTGGQS